MTIENPFEAASVTRRDFLKTAAGVSAGLVIAPAVARGTETQALGVHPGGSDLIRVGVIGAGGRGTGAAIQCVQSSPNIVITALGDPFSDRVENSRRKLTKDIGDKSRVTDETCFTGLDAYKKVLAADVDLVILAAPPGFRPLHLKAAVEAGKHVFMEKPVAVDPVGVRSVIESSEFARQKGLGIGVGTQRRHDPSYKEIIRRIQDGAIGEVLGGQCSWCQEGLWSHKQKPEWSDMEWQMRNWLYFDWLSGDHIVEQHVHNLDVINWVMGGPPKQAFGVGGREVRTDPLYGNIFDHFSVEYEYPNGARIISMARQTDGCSTRINEFVIGTKGRSDPSRMIEGENAFTYEAPGEPVDPQVQEHTDLISSIRDGNPINDGKRIAESTLTAIMGRMSAYTGRAVSWKWAMNSSKLDLTPPHYELRDLAVNPIPVPGKTELI